MADTLGGQVVRYTPSLNKTPTGSYVIGSARQLLCRGTFIINIVKKNVYVFVMYENKQETKKFILIFYTSFIVTSEF